MVAYIEKANALFFSGQTAALKALVGDTALLSGTDRLALALLHMRESRYAEALEIFVETYARFPNQLHMPKAFIDCCVHFGRLDLIANFLGQCTAHHPKSAADNIILTACYLSGAPSLYLPFHPPMALERAGDASVPDYDAIYLSLMDMRHNGIKAGLANYKKRIIGADVGADCWHGSTALPKILHVRKTVGIGDFFQFSRYVAALPLMGCERVVLEESYGRQAGLLPRPLAPSAQHIATAAALHFHEPAPYEEMWTNDFFLFTALFPILGYFQQPAPLFAVPEDNMATALAQAIRAKAKGKPCRLIFWSACESAGDFAFKSLSLKDILPLFEQDDVHWVVAQRGIERENWLAHPLAAKATTLPETLNYKQTAALMTKLDGVVSIDSSLLHLAASLRLPTYGLIPTAGCFRWEREVGRSSWYDTLNIIRPTRLGDWPNAVTQLLQHMG
jgi:Glycosyltransferase family 9 (heptosyltransferase)